MLEMRKVDNSRKNGLRETSFAEIRKRDPGTCVASGPERSHIQLPQATARATAAPRPVWRLGLTNARGRRSLTVTHRTPESRQFAAHCHSRHVTDHSASDDVTDRHASASFYAVSRQSVRVTSQPALHNNATARGRYQIPLPTVGMLSQRSPSRCGWRATGIRSIHVVVAQDLCPAASTQSLRRESRRVCRCPHPPPL